MSTEPKENILNTTPQQETGLAFCLAPAAILKLEQLETISFLNVTYSGTAITGN